MVILVTGASGQVGKSFQSLTHRMPEAQWTFTEKSELDIRSKTAVAEFFGHLKPDVIINAAAYTAVDNAEEERELAEEVNAEGPANLAAYCKGTAVQFIHYSTDYVYHNTINRPLRETDPTQPLSFYGKTKLSGEKKAMDQFPDCTIIRTSWVYAPMGHNFVLKMLSLAEKNAVLKVIDDQIGTPTLASDLAEATIDLIQGQRDGRGDYRGQIFNYSNEGVCSWFDFAKAIFELTNKSREVIPIPSSEFPSKAQRPFYSLMSKEKIRGCLSKGIPHWRDSLQKCIQQIGLYHEK